MASLQDLHSSLLELEPVTLSDNTEVKVPVSNANNVQYDYELEEYNRLTLLYREIPSDLFISRLLKDYSSCEVKLEQTRSMLFCIVRECDDFPYGLQEKSNNP